MAKKFIDLVHEEPKKEEKITKPSKKQVAFRAKAKCALNVRAAASMDAKIVHVFNADEKLNVYSVDGEWAVVEEGFCKVEYLQKI